MSYIQEAVRHVPLAVFFLGSLLCAASGRDALAEKSSRFEPFDQCFATGISGML